MARYLRAQVRLSMDSGLPADDVTNTFHFIQNAGTAIEAYDDIVQCLTIFYAHFDEVVLGENLSGNGTIKVYDLAEPEPRTPIQTHTATPLVVPAVSANNLPPEVAACVSWNAFPESGVQIQSLRGRTFIGPLTGAAIGADGLLTAAVTLALAEGAHQLLEAAQGAGVPLAIYSPTRDATLSLADSFRVVSYGHVDNAPDIIRSRGVLATSRTTFSFAGP